jgi:hypothetical protein
MLKVKSPSEINRMINGSSVPVHVLVRFLRDAQKALESRSEVDSALRFECFADYLEQDHKPGVRLDFKGYVIGL